MWKFGALDILSWGWRYAGSAATISPIPYRMAGIWMQNRLPRDTNEMPNLDLLRSIAVLLVVVEHTLLAMQIFQIGYWQIRWLGVVGVFMFFVHTSLVLMWSLDRKPDALDFYIRRAFRIYPLAVVVLLITIAFRIPTLKVNGASIFQVSGPGNIFSNLLLVQNLVWRGNILGVMWTLPLEVQMYLLLPFLYFFLRKKFDAWPILMLLMVTTMYDRVAFSSQDGTFAICIPYFLCGVLAYVLFTKLQPRLPSFLFPILVAALLAGFMLRPSWKTGWALTFVLGVALPLFRQIRAKWLIRSSHEVAKYSYGIYLVHSWAITLGVVYLHHFNLGVRIAAIAVCTAFPAVVLYHGLERPLIRMGAKLAARVAARAKVSEMVTPTVPGAVALEISCPTTAQD